MEELEGLIKFVWTLQTTG